MIFKKFYLTYWWDPIYDYRGQSGYKNNAHEGALLIPPEIQNWSLTTECS